MIGIIADYVNVVFVVVGKDRNVYIFLFAGTAMSLLADFILIPNLGMYGIAISNIIVNAVLAAVTLALLYIQKYIKPILFSKDDFYTLKEWAKIGVFSGMQQFIGLAAYSGNGLMRSHTKRLRKRICGTAQIQLPFRSGGSGCALGIDGTVMACIFPLR